MAVFDDLVQLPLCISLLFTILNLVYEEVLLYLVAIRVEHHAVARQTVPACAPRLLVVCLQRLWQFLVDHQPHVRLVDPHAERDGCGDDVHLVAYEAFLVPTTRHGIHPRVVRQSLESFVSKPVRQILGVLARKAVYDGGLASALSQQPHKLLVRPTLRTHLVLEIRPVETGDELLRSIQPELGDYVAAYSFRRSRCQRDEGNVRKTLPQIPQRPVVRSKVMPPLRYAMCLIYRHKAHFQRAQK